MKDYLLVSVCDREIVVEQFDSLEEAQETMHKEMICEGKIPEEVVTDNEEYGGENYSFGKWSAWANNGVNHGNYDWRIFKL